MTFEPARISFCGLSLRTTISMLIFFDIFRGVIGLSSVASTLIEGADSLLSRLSGHTIPSLLIWRALQSGLILVGAIIGLIGINQSRHKLVSAYAYTIIGRIIVSIAIATVSFMYFQDIVDQMVDNIAKQITDEAHRKGLPDPEIDRDAIGKPIRTYLAFYIVANELITDILALYFAYITKSLAVWMQRGELNPTQRFLYAFALPSSLAGSHVPMLHGSRVSVNI